MKTQKSITGFTSILNDFYEMPQGKTSLNNENKLVGFFGSSFMIIGSICSFLSLHYFMNLDIAELWFFCLVMFIMGISILMITVLVKNEIAKTYVLAVIFSAYIVFTSHEYYTFIGPAVLLIAIILIVISLLYTNKRMLVIVLAVTILNAEYYAYNNFEFNNWEMFYQAELVTLFILSAAIITIHIINRKRSDIIYRQYNDINKSEEKLKLTLESVGDGVITVNAQEIIEFMNPIAQALTGWDHNEAVGASFESVFNIINEYTREKTENPVKLVFKTKEIVQLANHTLLISRDGTERAIEDTAAPIKDYDNHVIGCVLVFRDFSDKKEKQKQIEYLSYHDHLSGLYNRRFFEEELKRLDTQRNLPISFIYADVNGLKIINDAFGHIKGDEIIQLVANSLKTECRADDIIARVGGDEFCILLPRTDENIVEKLVMRLKEVIEQKKIMEIHISISFGWSTKTDENQSSIDVLKVAEDIMYQKKILNSSSKRNGIIKSILNSLLIKCPREEAHSKRVSLICEEIGRAYNLKEDEIIELRTAGELHDIGKIALDETILNKPEKLSHAEWAQIQLHPETGYRLLSATSEFISIAEYVLAHHERWDGTGYPKGLHGEAINWKARVIALADAYDAMTCDRPYRKALSEAAAVIEVKKNAGTQFDPDIARVFIEKVLGFVW